MENLNFQTIGNTDDVRLLNQAIDSFSCAALKFEKHYQRLEARIRELKIELNKKNDALKANLKKKEDIENHLHNILESMTVGIVVVNLKGIITTFNRSAEKITGLRSAEVVGRELDRIPDIGFFQNLQLGLESLEGLQDSKKLEAEITRKGEAIIHVSLSISPLTTPLGKKVGIVVTIQDVTQMKKLEERANRTSRLSAMGEMAAKIAHEIRNPLGSIELFASTLANDAEVAVESKVVAEHISSGVKSIDNIISNLLLFILPEQKASFELIDIHDSLKDSLFFSNHLIGSNESIKVVSDYHLEPILVQGDPELLKQTYLNLILNAIQSMPNGGNLTISTRRVDGRKQMASAAEIRFTDTGCGIIKSDMPRIFDPFFTTKKRGTGLGLAIVHNIIKLHGGAIDINSSKDNGTTCIITLPLWETEDGA